MNWSSLTKQRNLLTYGVMALAGGLAIVLSHVFANHHLLAILLKEVGFALLVAIFLVATVERFTRERHEAATHQMMEEMNRNIFFAIFRRYIPEKVFDEVEKLVMEANVFRTKHELDYTIDEIGGGKADCIAQTSYELTSVVDTPIKHDIVVNLELPIDSADISRCFIEEVRVGDTTYNQADLLPHIKRDNEHCKLTLPIHLQARASVRVSTKSRLVKKSTDVEIWASRVPSDGLKLTVSTPSKGLEVYASANHSEPLRTQLDNEVTKKWDLPYGIFPYQSIMFWWKPKIDPKVAIKVLTQGATPVTLSQTLRRTG